MRKTKGNFRQLTYSDRLKIETLLNSGCSVAYIAKAVHHSKQTIYNEIKRGEYIHLKTDYTETVKYSADLAQSRRDKNQNEKGPNLKIGNCKGYADLIEDLIVNKKYSPEAALLYIQNCDIDFDISICKTTLYKYIDMGIFLNLTNKNLPVKGKRRNKHKKVKRIKRASAGESIEYRSDEISSRETFGHWEMDTVKGVRKQTKGCLLVLTERFTREEIVMKLKNQKALSVVTALDTLKKKFGSIFLEIFKTITVDNGVEFSDYAGMKKEKGDIEIYYCHPYSSWERGTNENNNKLIRRHIPKGTDIDKYTDKQIYYMQRWINNYPRKIFNGLSSQQMFDRELEKLGIHAPENFF